MKLYRLLVKAPLYNIFRRFSGPKILPINYTFSITNACNSKCKTCFIWRLYSEKPELKSRELTTEEWVRTFESLGKSPFWVTISGGEPFLRRDIVKICQAISEINEPMIINIPTNGLLPERVKAWTPAILEACTENGIELVVNLSLDGIGSFHDEVRGVKGNWETSLKTISVLKELKDEYACLTVGIHTVISRYNVNVLPEIAEYLVGKLEPDHYVMEVAEERSELFNSGNGVTPNPEKLRDGIDWTMKFLRAKSKDLHGISKLSLAFRLKYYQLMPEIIGSNRQVIPCMASFASCHINPYGDLWPCCVLGYKKSLGNLRDFGYNFEKLWKSKEAEEVRKAIREGDCSCPLANAHYTNLLLNLREATEILVETLLGRLKN